MAGELEIVPVTKDNVMEAADRIDEFMQRPAVGPWVFNNRRNTWARLGLNSWDERSYALASLNRALLYPLDHRVIDHRLYLRQDRMVALGWKIADITLLHKDSGLTRTGRAIDCIGDEDVSLEEAIRVATDLRHADDYNGPVVATLTPEEEKRAQGIRRVLHPIGKLSTVEVVAGPPGVGLSGESYTLYQLFSSEPEVPALP